MNFPIKQTTDLVFQDPRLPEFLSINVSGPAFSYGGAISDNGTVFLNTGTGGLTPHWQVCVSLGWVDRDKQGFRQPTDDFLTGGSAQFNYGQAPIGAGKIIAPGGNSATLLNIGTPALPSANFGYSTRLDNVLGREKESK